MGSETPTPTTTPETPAAPERTNFAERVNFDSLYAGLSAQGISLTDEEKRTLEETVQRRARQFDGVDMNNDMGGGIVRLLYMFVYFLQNIGDNREGFSMEGFGDWFGERGGQTLSSTELRMLNETTMAIHGDLMAQGGNLAAAADLITGQAIGSAPRDMAGSLFHQLLNDPTTRITDRELAQGTWLNRNYDVAEVTGPSSPMLVGQRPATPGLTGPSIQA